MPPPPSKSQKQQSEPPAVVSTATWWSIVGLQPSRDSMIDPHLPSPRLLSIGKHPKPPAHAPVFPPDPPADFAR